MDMINKSQRSPVIFIAIDGKGGAGKSTLASSLANVLKAEIIHTDDFTAFDKPAFDGSNKVIKNVFKPISKGARSLSYNRMQVWPGELDRISNQSVTEIMIIEGCGVSCKKFRPYLSYVIAVELDDRTRIERIIERDVVKGGRDEVENEAIGKLWEEAENEYFLTDNPALRADLIVDASATFNTTTIIERLNRIR